MDMLGSIYGSMLYFDASNAIYGKMARKSYKVITKYLIIEKRATSSAFFVCQNNNVRKKNVQTL